MKKFRAWFFIGLLVLIVSLFFKPFFLEGRIPIPADTIVGMYHPFRDLLADQYSRGFPFKNFLITDPVRQQYPWRFLAIKGWQKGEIPWWNPYSFTGQPLLANFQSASFYPFNVLFFLLPFNLAWSILIISQPLLAGLFLYLYLRHSKLSQPASFLGGFSFAFSGFMVAWLEWGTIGHVALWLPLILLSIDKIISQNQGQNTSILSSIEVNKWSLVFLFSLTSSFLAGHLQTAFYVLLFSLIYLGWRILQIKDKQKIIKLIILFSILLSLFSILTFPQWWPTLQFIKLSARGIDLDWQKPGWFIPWTHLIQFFAPDFFGNPATLNYWGEWNYGEFIGFVGVIPLILALYSASCSFVPTRLLSRRRFVTALAVGIFLFLSFALPTPWAKLVYQLKIPFLSTSQPTRLLLLVDFCLAILAAFGLEKLLKKEKSFIKVALLISVIFAGLWVIGEIGEENLLVARRNLILPTSMLVVFCILTSLFWLKKLPHYLFLSGLLFLTIFDLLRFGWKFIPFSPEEFIFPQTGVINFLKEQQEKQPPFRIMTTDKRILPPNFSAVYQLQELGGYDPLYLLRFGELVAAMERDKPDLSPPFGFNRIIVPVNYQSRLVDFLNVKYVLSLTDLDSPKLKLVYQEGETRVYENRNVFPRAFLADDYRVAKTKQEVISLLMDEEVDLSKTIILEKDPQTTIQPCSHSAIGEGDLEIIKYSPNRIEITVNSPCDSLLLLSDSFYPGWQATIDGQKTKIYQANYHYRAIIVPEGPHQVIYQYQF